jgi:hypothetical protein
VACNSCVAYVDDENNLVVVHHNSCVASLEDYNNLVQSVCTFKSLCIPEFETKCCRNGWGLSLLVSDYDCI